MQFRARLRELPLVEPQLLPLFVDVLADSLRLRQHRRSHPMKDLAPCWPRDGDFACAISQQFQRLVLSHEA